MKSASNSNNIVNAAIGARPDYRRLTQNPLKTYLKKREDMPETKKQMKRQTEH